MAKTKASVKVPAMPAQWVIGFSSTTWRRLKVPSPRTYRGEPIKGVWSNPTK